MQIDVEGVEPSSNLTILGSNYSRQSPPANGDPLYKQFLYCSDGLEISPKLTKQNVKVFGFSSPSPAVITTSRASNPCLIALRDDAVLPLSVVGPVERRAFRRFASIFFSEVDFFGLGVSDFADSIVVLTVFTNRPCRGLQMIRLPTERKHHRACPRHSLNVQSVGVSLIFFPFNNPIELLSESGRYTKKHFKCRGNFSTLDFWS